MGREKGKLHIHMAGQGSMKRGRICNVRAACLNCSRCQRQSLVVHVTRDRKVQLSENPCRLGNKNGEPVLIIFHAIAYISMLFIFSILFLWFLVCSIVISRQPHRMAKWKRWMGKSETTTGYWNLTICSFNLYRAEYVGWGGEVTPQNQNPTIRNQ